MYGDDGYKLALEAKRTAIDRLPVFNRELVQAVCRETRYLAESLERRLRAHTEMAAAPRTPARSMPSQGLTPAHRFEILTEHLVMQRNKRCLLGYLHRRMQVVMQDTWRRGGSLPVQANATSAVNESEASYARAAGQPSGAWDETMLSAGEAAFRRDYARLLRRYAATYADVGLLEELRPPKELYVQVRAIRDGGLVQTEGGGAIRLEPGTQCFIARQEAQRLIGLGLVCRV
ncbi:hypothetical protein THASP1DRAFT_20875 [Thamnocephalis sphaerospora]|uniref:DNA replication complex GINS protein PSF1 n=1 Tax=Thamnocephalis sphaerospora TaxID=78915 RepID=A0A4P9XGB2_9FUNG|nr:hypothetical protein THASP1DRAFT_20875 [Thamnocephalis sphaerospora]|eukprot:RKP04673.1 hypothetical protein THASP1DRAFT_20875 [Thamnocephalis sphaerospora]